MNNKNKCYGLPYQGSKNKIAEWILSNLPRARHFYDLFAGGCAISHCAIEQRKYKNIHINDISPSMPEAFMDAVHGKFRNENRWISHDDFFRLRRSGDVYVDICFSFGSRPGNTYAYSRELEPIKKAVHYAVFFKDYSLLKDVTGVDMSRLDSIEGAYERYLYLKSATGNNCLEHFSRLLRIQSLERLNRMNELSYIRNTDIDDIVSLSSLSYDEVEIEPDSVIYADIPYINTGRYNRQKFDHERFYDWASRQTQPLFISEYYMPEDRFVCIAERQKRCFMAANDNTKMSVERIYVPKHQYRELKPLTLF